MMKSLTEFKSITEEIKSDYSKFDALVRAGLANKAQIQRLHKILEKMKEEKPTFSRADQMIVQNLFNKMIDLIVNNKQIFTQTKRAIQEETEIIDEGSVVDVAPEPPPVLMLKRKSVRLFTDGTKVGLYYNNKINKYFTVAMTVDEKKNVNIQAEEYVENIDEAVMDTLHKIVSGKQAQRVKFASGHTRKVDHFTASAITQVHNALNDENKKKFSDMIHKSPDHFVKAADFAFKHSK